MEAALGVTFDSLTNELIEIYSKSLIPNKDKTYDPRTVKEAPFGLNFPFNIKDSSARITKHCADCLIVSTQWAMQSSERRTPIIRLRSCLSVLSHQV